MFELLIVRNKKSTKLGQHIGAWLSLQGPYVWTDTWTDIPSDTWMWWRHMAVIPH